MILYRALQPLLLNLYRIATLIAKATPGLSERTRKFRTTYDIRYIGGKPAFSQIDVSKFNGRRPIWIHAASGEFEYAKPIIRELARLSSPPPVLVTYFSPTFANNVHAFPGVTAACPLPLDSRDELEQFLEKFNPSHLLIARTDAWPNTVLATHLRKIPILLFATTFHSRSGRLRGWGKRLTIDTLKLIDQIQCVSDDDRDVLNSIGIKNVQTCGDSRYDQVLERLKNTAALPDAFTNAVLKNTFVAGSVWREDLEPVFAASNATFTETPHTLIVVPHEISESFSTEIENVAQKIGVKQKEIIRFSKLKDLPLNHGTGNIATYRVIIVDAVGFLAELYTLGQIAFVGGSFRKTVHSVMEPLAAGCFTIVGPLHTNNREAIEFQKLMFENAGATVPLVTAVRDAADFTIAIRKLWTASTVGGSKQRLQDEIRKRGGATAHVLQWLENQKVSG